MKSLLPGTKVAKYTPWWMRWCELTGKSTVTVKPLAIFA